ncbi:MAG: hypothetical protein MJ054_02220 [Clostridia bacterium]|nr:hypothetical protein [Clostridia bacterium]
MKSSARSYTVRKSKPTINKSVKIPPRNISSGLFLVVLIFLVFGVCIGGFTVKRIIKDDKFEMIPQANGQVDVEIGGEDGQMSYEELGAVCVSFGKNKSESVKINYLYREDIANDVVEVDCINPSIAGIYYVVYTSSDIKYRTVQLIRNVIVVRSED